MISSLLFLINSVSESRMFHVKHSSQGLQILALPVVYSIFSSNP
jgi:hypothetical protein